MSTRNIKSFSGEFKLQVGWENTRCPLETSNHFQVNLSCSGLGEH